MNFGNRWSKAILYRLPFVKLRSKHKWYSYTLRNKFVDLSSSQRLLKLYLNTTFRERLNSNPQKWWQWVCFYTQKRNEYIGEQYINCIYLKKPNMLQVMFKYMNSQLKRNVFIEMCLFTSNTNKYFFNDIYKRVAVKQKCSSKRR